MKVYLDIEGEAWKFSIGNIIAEFEQKSGVKIEQVLDVIEADLVITDALHRAINRNRRQHYAIIMGTETPGSVRSPHLRLFNQDTSEPDDLIHYLEEVAHNLKR